MHRIDLPDWAVERGRRMNRFDRIDPRRTALLAVDLQNAFTRPGEVFANSHACDILPNVNRLAKALRNAGGYIVWTRQTFTFEPPRAQPRWQFDATDPFVRKAMDALSDGADGQRLHDALNIHADDVVLNKYRYSAFIQGASDIDTALIRRNVDTLIVAGTLTNVCCESSARDAYMLGYRVLFAADATAAVTDAEHNAALLNLCLNFADVRTTEHLIGLIEGGPQARRSVTDPQPPIVRG
jgi:nicotinamidase-related amidase